eukprot:213598-Hanusia_phi.AAC.4
MMISPFHSFRLYMSPCSFSLEDGKRPCLVSVPLERVAADGRRSARNFPARLHLIEAVISDAKMRPRSAMTMVVMRPRTVTAYMSPYPTCEEMRRARSARAADRRGGDEHGPESVGEANEHGLLLHLPAVDVPQHRLGQRAGGIHVVVEEAGGRLEGAEAVPEDEDGEDPSEGDELKALPSLEQRLDDIETAYVDLREGLDGEVLGHAVDNEVSDASPEQAKSLEEDAEDR